MKLLEETETLNLLEDEIQDYPNLWLTLSCILSSRLGKDQTFATDLFRRV